MLTDPYSWARRAHGRSIACILAGDINVQDRVVPESVFGHLRGTLAGADVLYGNLEGCLSRPGRNDVPGKPGWRHSDAAMVAAMVSARFDAVGCANNVTCGADAIAESLRVLDSAGIAHCGAGANRQLARAPAVVCRRGVRFGFLQFTARLSAPEQAASSQRSGVAAFDPLHPRDISEICEDVARLRSHVDFLVVAHHLRLGGGIEPELYQRHLARACVDAGADVVYGHGAHVNQGFEHWKGAPIFHCIGQLAFDWPRMRRHKEGMLVRLLVEDGRLISVSAILLWRDEDNNPYLLDPRTDMGRQQVSTLRRLSPRMLLSVQSGEIGVAAW